MAFHDAAAKENAWLADETRLSQTGGIPRLGRIRLDDVIVFIYVIGVAENQIAFGMRLEMLKHRADGTWIIDVVGIEPANDSSFCATNSFVNRVGLAAVAFGNPIQSAAITMKNIDGAVRATAIDDHVIQ